ncbi:MAG: carbamoyltransferase HypF [Chloroflexi bacterium]|nr:carbamoyltransferase HypF [Chloroflexota bacterium]
MHGKRIHIGGVVQGVGFRPFVFSLAHRFSLMGWVRNSSAGVDIEVDGFPDALAQFVEALEQELPPLAHIDHISVTDCPPNGYNQFEIIHSRPISGAFQPISPDMTICSDCLGELLDPIDRRFRYPFINCTHCGPRFTIIKDIPYDRPLTTMAGFEMCSECAAEYADPLNRRFHAQPIACPICGPKIWLEGLRNSEFGVRNDSSIHNPQSAIKAARKLLADGNILAVKGVGGFHLACDGLDETAVSELRRRKLRVDKPFALMMADVATVDKYCQLNAAERELLTSRERPIVILKRRANSPIATAVAPGQNTIGVMLPYTPLHALLLEQATDFPEALVMTSGNLREEPIAIDNDEARQRLASLADAFLMHNRDIQTRCDDSVMRIAEFGTRNVELCNLQSPIRIPIRRSRGYAPFPVKLPWQMPPLLAVGGELKNTFCLANGRYAFLSHHIGDLENYETLQSFEEGVAHFERLFRVKPELLAYDLHPNYLASRYAVARTTQDEIPAIAVQHHHAHIASCMAEHGLDGDNPVIGVAFDGTGYGNDGRIWGGEFLLADYAGFERPFHLKYFPMAGGDTAVREPWRLALACLHQANIPWQDDLPPVQHANHFSEHDLATILRHQLEKGINAPLTSSMGRLFDAVAALIGVRQTVNYEAQAAIELEMLVDPSEIGSYSLAIGESNIDPAPMFEAIIADLRQAVPVSIIAARFHNGIARMVLEICRQVNGISTVALSGGVWQNMALFSRTVPILQNAGFTVLWHQKAPTNDGGLALGQAAVAAATVNKENI